MTGRRREPPGRHEPLIMTIRRPRAKVAPALTDGQLILRALADGARYREWRAIQWCAGCDADPDGVCPDHLNDGALTGAYRELAERLAEVLPAPEGEAGP